MENDQRGGAGQPVEGAPMGGGCCPLCGTNMDKSFQVVAYAGHIGIVDPRGFSILNVIDQGGLTDTLKLAHLTVNALNRARDLAKGGRV